MDNTCCYPEEIKLYVEGSLSEEECRSLEEHASECARCSATIEAALREESHALMHAMSIVETPQEVHLRVLDRRRHFLPQVPRAWLPVLGLATIAGAVWLGATLSPTQVMMAMVPKAVAAPVNDEDRFIGGLSDFGFERGIIGWGNYEDEKDEIVSRSQDTRYPHFEEIDSTTSRSGKSSLRLYHRQWGGRAERQIDLPVPPNTLIKLAFWALTPKGGSPQNKWLSAGISTDTGDGVSVDVIDPSPHWRPFVVNFTTGRAARRLLVEFNTSSGKGEIAPGVPYDRNDWSSWIDDVAISLQLPFDISAWQASGDRLQVECHVSEPYSAKDIVADSISLRVGHSEIPLVNGRILSREGNKVRLEFHSTAAVSRMNTPYTDTGDPKTAQVLGFVRYGSIDVPFVAGLTKANRGNTP